MATAVAALVLFCAHLVSAVEDFNGTESMYSMSVNGQSVLVPETLMRRLQEEQAAWHWAPWQRTRLEYVNNVARELVTRDSIESFPDGILDEEQLRRGGFILYVLFGVYAFTLLGIVCNDYFIVCVELICEDLKIPQNVAAATFMSVATSCPEFFVNLISTFLTQSDMGIGTIVGSALFNCLGVAAIGALAAIRPIAIGMRPVTRDAVIYMVNVVVLVAIVWDGQVDWYEALVLTILYVLYFILMFNSMRLFALYDNLVAKCKSGSRNNLTEIPTPVEDGIKNKGFEDNTVVSAQDNQEKTIEPEGASMEGPVPLEELFKFPHGQSALATLVWLYLWPLRLVLGVTVPSPVRCRRLYPLTFFLCIVWIGVNSYFVSWSMTVIGHTFYIPDSVMGMTFLAFGGCLPEAFSIFIMSRRGEGGIGVSNALGANSLAILFALGTPWLIKCLANLSQGAEQPAVLINSANIDFVVGSLLVAVCCLWLVLLISKFTLRKSVGFVLCVLYSVFITFAILVEMGIILDR